MAIYRFNMKAKSTNSASHCAYISGLGKYKNKSDVEKVESHNMPNCDAPDFWLSCQRFERKNANLFKEFELSLPRELSDQANYDLVEKLRLELIPNQPCTVAIHSGRNGDNPHAHIMFSMRKNDGIERVDIGHFFKRANSKNPERGGAPKLDEWRGKDFIFDARKQWEVMVNESLELAQVKARVDCRSNKERGIKRKPQPKIPLKVFAIQARTSNSSVYGRFKVFIGKIPLPKVLGRRMAALAASKKLNKNKEREGR